MTGRTPTFRISFECRQARIPEISFISSSLSSDPVAELRPRVTGTEKGALPARNRGESSLGPAGSFERRNRPARGVSPHHLAGISRPSPAIVRLLVPDHFSDRSH